MDDLTLTCADCQERFLFTVAEQRFYAERGIRQPTRCAACRAARRAERNAALIATYESSREATNWSEIQSIEGYGLTNGQPRSRSGPRPTHRGVCAACGRETEVPFQPRSGRPIFCRDCFNARRGR